MTLLCKFTKLGSNKELKLAIHVKEANFNTKCSVLVNTTDIKQSIEEYKADLMKQVENFQEGKSGWNFDSVIQLHKWNPLKGSSYIELPKYIQNKKACINVKNTDQKCFLYSVILNDHPTISHVERGEKVFKNYIDKYNDDNINYPMSLDQIPIFEKQNNKMINVYTYRWITDEKTQKQKLKVYLVCSGCKQRSTKLKEELTDSLPYKNIALDKIPA